MWRLLWFLLASHPPPPARPVGVLTSGNYTLHACALPEGVYRWRLVRESHFRHVVAVGILGSSGDEECVRLMGDRFGTCEARIRRDHPGYLFTLQQDQLTLELPLTVTSGHLEQNDLHLCAAQLSALRPLRMRVLALNHTAGPVLLATDYLLLLDGRRACWTTRFADGTPAVTQRALTHISSYWKSALWSYRWKDYGLEGLDKDLACVSGSALAVWISEGEVLFSWECSGGEIGGGGVYSLFQQSPPATRLCPRHPRHIASSQS